MNFSEIDKARNLLGLGETATLKEIKAAYRRLAHLHHPDKHSSADATETETMKKLNRAYELLTGYCAEYRYSFHQENIARVNSQEEDYKRWHDNWSF